jgi:hypothetical protein
MYLKEGEKKKKIILSIANLYTILLQLVKRKFEQNLRLNTRVKITKKKKKDNKDGIQSNLPGRLLTIRTITMRDPLQRRPSCLNKWALNMKTL